MATADGDGKGKTSAAFGVALRAVGRGWKVLMIQYTKMGEWPKGEPMGEIHGAKRLAPDFDVFVPDLPGFGDSAHPKQVLDLPQLADGLLAWMDVAGLGHVPR